MLTSNTNWLATICYSFNLKLLKMATTKPGDLNKPNHTTGGNANGGSNAAENKNFDEERKEADKIHEEVEIEFTGMLTQVADGENRRSTAIYGYSEDGRGVVARSGNGVGLVAGGKGGAARFDGDVTVKGNIVVSGDISLLNADCAEDFDIADTCVATPGTVMVMDENGFLCKCSSPYDKRVAGVISGAGDYKPGVVLDRNGATNNRAPIALLGKVFCYVDADYGAVEVGDLLTTSPSMGQAMKAVDSTKAFGAVIGKALRPLERGQGLIPILIALQ
jgi:hypothetical protein